MTEETQNNSQSTAENASASVTQSNNAESTSTSAEPTNNASTANNAESSSTASAPANNAENAPVVTMKTYYWSTDDVPFRVITSNDELTANQYPLVVNAPDPSLKSPKYDWMKRQWYDISEESYGQRLTEAIDGLKNLEGSVTSLQEAHSDTLQSVQAGNEAVNKLQAAVQQAGQMVASLSAMITASSNKNSQSSTSNNEVNK